MRRRADAPAASVHAPPLAPTPTPPCRLSTRNQQNSLFSVVKYESVIHEFDPYFNYRVTQFLTSKGFYDM